MNYDFLPKELFSLAKKIQKETNSPLYVVGGSIRDLLSGFSLSSADLDLCAPVSAQDFTRIAVSEGFHADAVYSHTGTVKISFCSAENNADSESASFGLSSENNEKPTDLKSEKHKKRIEAEFASFRSDKYVRGTHTPVETLFTNDILLDAKRRDFTCNSVYYDILNDKIVDPLGGVADIKNRILRAANHPDKVFGEDGLRLLRLARFAGTTGFTPTAEVMKSAKKNATLVADVSPERIFAELKQILTADEKYGNENGVYTALKVLDETRALDVIFPELALGRDLRQREDFHNYDVLEHSLRAAAYSAKAHVFSQTSKMERVPFEVRLAALLHDIGKPAAFFRDGKYYNHPEVGAEIVNHALKRLKAPTKTIELAEKLTRYHMYDYDLCTKEGKLRKFIVSKADILSDLLLVKQADFSACKDVFSTAPSVVRISALAKKMRSEGVPFSVKELAVRGDEIAPLLPSPKFIGIALETLLLHCAVFPADNTKTRLLSLLPKVMKEKLEG